MLSMNTLLNKDVLIIELDGALDSVTGSDFKSWIEEKMLFIKKKDIKNVFWSSVAI